MIIHNKYPSKFKISNSALERNILYSNKMWDILEKTWRYDPLDRISLMNIATLLIQLRNQQLTINNELKDNNSDYSKQNNDEINLNSSAEYLPNSINLDSTSHSNNQLVKKSSKVSLHMKHSASANCIDNKDSENNIDNFDPDRKHRRSISNVETSSSIQNLVNKDTNKIKNQNISNTSSSLNESHRIPKSMNVTSIEDYHSNSLQIINSKTNSMEKSHNELNYAKSTNSLIQSPTDVVEEKNNYVNNRTEKSKLCQKYEQLYIIVILYYII